MIKLNEKYNPETFATFLRDFLPEDFEEKEQDIADVSKCKVIKNAREIGHCPSLEVTVLEMEHDKETDPRVAIATDAFKLLALYGIDKALVIFNNKESDNYRFSYLTIKLDLDENGNVKKTYSNARRHSFFLGTGAKVKTPEQQLIKKGRVKGVDDLLSRFSLEVVNKQFYLEVAKHFDELIKTDAHFLELPFQSDPNVRKNFAMRLVGRLMFCWFLKQKRSEQGQLIPDEILSANAVADNYYHKTLEPLFFEVLNTQIDSRDIRSDLYDKVPYLNGGLFSPQADDYYELDRATFVSRHINTLKVSDKWFKAFFDLLETYNFTIDENTVFDQELSVDPEMLGRIFENLLAEINPETGSSERKRTGSFYTPRQIVEYMVDQSLLEYLKSKTGIEEEKLQALISYDLDDDSRHPRTEDEDRKIVEAIETLKVLDPACGSGAFPIGTLQKIVWILQNVDPDCKLWLEKKLAGVPDLYRQKIINEVQSNPFDYTRKLDVIKNSIFGVDIQPIAVEISRLRCFLTLVVESEIHDSKQNRGIEPLPNLDFKFVCANTLIGLPKSEEKGLFEDHSGIEELSSIMSEYFSCSNQRKSEIRLRFTNTQKEILNKTLRKFGGAAGDLTVKLTLWDPFSNKSNPWFDAEWMFGTEKKFDVVIGNPPYITMSKGKKQKIFDQEYIRLLEKIYSEVKEYKNNIFSYFIKNSLDVLSEQGLLSFIVPNALLYNNSFSKLRRYMLITTDILYVLDIKDKVFESAEIGGNCVFVASKHRIGRNIQFIPLKDKDLVFPSEMVLLSPSDVLANNDARFNSDKTGAELLKKINQQGTALDHLCKFYNGIKSGNNKEYLREEKIESCDELVIRGRDVHSYIVQPLTSYIHFDPSKLWSNFNAEILRKRNQIVLRQTGDSLIAALNQDGLLRMDTTHGLYDISIDVYYLLGLLNSKLLTTWHKLFTSEKGRTFAEVKIVNIKQLPIALPEDEEVSKLVRKIVSEKAENIEADTLQLEQQIDDLVFDIYRLTEEEKEIVRNS